MDIKDYAQMMRYLTRPKDVVPDPSTMDQEPRNMAQGGRIDYNKAGYVKPATEAQEAEALKRFKKPFNELDAQTRSRIRTGSYSNQEIGSWKKSPVTKMQEKIAQKIYNKPFEDLSKDRKTRIRTGKIT